MHALASPTPSPLPPREAARRFAPSGHAGIDLLRWAQIARGRFRLTSHSSDASTAVSARPVGKTTVQISGPIDTVGQTKRIAFTANDLSCKFTGLPETAFAVLRSRVINSAVRILHEHDCE